MPRRRTPTAHDELARGAAPRQRQRAVPLEAEADFVFADEDEDVDVDVYAAADEAAYVEAVGYDENEDPVVATVEFYEGQPIGVTFEEPPPPRRRRRRKRAPAKTAQPFPWRKIVGAVVSGAVAGLNAYLAAEAARAAAAARGGYPPPPYDQPPPPPRASAPPPPSPPIDPIDPEELDDMRAAMLLRVPLNASETQIRAAWRALVRDKLGKEGFHDQGGDPRVTSAYVTAKNRLIARARRMAHARR